MKKIIILSFCLLVVASAAAQKQFELYQIKGTVFIMQYGTNDWKTASPRMALNEDDIIDVKRNSSISILEKKSGRIYQSDRTGKLTISKRIEKAEKESEKLFRQLNKELVKAANKDAKENNGYVSYAAVTRGGGDDIYDTMNALIKYVFMSAPPNPMASVDVERHVLDNGGCYYVVANNGSETLYFNAVTLKGNKIIHIYDFTQSALGVLPIQAKTRLDLSPFVMSGDMGDVVFLFNEKPFMMSKLEHSSCGDIRITSPNTVDGVICIYVR